jgi:cysteinyl-tRNA synthetase
MSLKHLGAPVDIHGGGSDLIYPHHESEIAQSEGATGIRPFARFWMHTAMVYLGGEKMSKSLGNMVFVRDLVPRYGSDAVRLYLLRCHYRSELAYDEAHVEEAAQAARRLTDAVTAPSGARPSGLNLASYRDKFVERMRDDLDTPGAVAVLLELAAAIGASRDHDLAPAQELLRELGDVLGLRLEARDAIQPAWSASARPAPDQPRSSGCS